MSFLPLSDRDQKAFTKLYASAEDLRMARGWAELIKKQKLYRQPWSRGKIYLRQAAYVTALVVAYGRVFAPGRGGFNFPKRLIPYDADELGLHHRLMELRHKVHAHTDLDKWKVKPWRVGSFSTALVGQPKHLIVETDIELFLSMTEKLLAKIAARKEEIVRVYASDEAVEAPVDAVGLFVKAALQLEVGESFAVTLADGETSADSA